MLTINKIYETIKEIKLSFGKCRGSGWGELPDRYWEEGLSQGSWPGVPSQWKGIWLVLPGRAGNRCPELSSELGTALFLMGLLRAEPCSRAAVFSSWLRAELRAPHPCRHRESWEIVFASAPYL